MSKFNKPVRSSSSKGCRREHSTIRSTNSLFPSMTSRSEYNTKKAGRMDGDDVEKLSSKSLKLSKSPLVKSTSFNRTSSGSVVRSQSKKHNSKIPRSKSNLRTENEILKIERIPKSDEWKDVYSKKDEEKTKKESVEDGKQSTEVKKTESGSLDSRSSGNLEIHQNSSVSSYKDAEEEIIQEILIEERANEELLRLMLNGEEKIDEEREAEMQEKVIKNLYETTQHSKKKPMYEKFRLRERNITGRAPRCSGRTPSRSRDQHPEANALSDSKKNVMSVQEHYDSTIQEITQVWKNTVSVIDCVKDHTVKYVEEKSGKIDKEQLTLEAEMLQLAVDFAISYSKLKMDFLLKSTKKQLEVKEVEKSELETFLDSKTFAALYNEEDLAAMAQTVKELNASILKGEDIGVM